MKKILFLLIIVNCYANLKAQYVAIPDPYFVTWLQANVPSAMNGYHMDTTSLAVTTRTIVDIHVTQQQNYHIVNLTGIQYFTSLKFLNCSGNYINTLPKLSSTLDSLFCNSISTTTINVLPPNLKKLIISGSNLVSLPPLPSSLRFLSVASPSLTGLPALPASLEYLACNSSPGYISHSLPQLPNTLKYLYCSLFKLDSLPNLPNSLLALDCQMNLISQLPTLPSNLKFLNCSYLQLSSMPSLPSSMTDLICIGNHSLTTLPTLPLSLKVLTCGGNSLTNLPVLPQNLKELTCSYSPINNIATVLPEFLEKLDCRYDSLISLPSLPSTLKTLICNNNKISCIPTLPASINYIDLSNNLFSCLPNYISAMDNSYFSYPLCSPSNTLSNPNGCERAYGIYGYTYLDADNNCSFNSSDLTLKNIEVQTFNQSGTLIQSSSSFQNGSYNTIVSSGTYNTAIDTTNKPFTYNCSFPGIDTLVTISSIKPIVDSVNFSIKCKPGFDLGIQSVLTNGIIFPGQTHQLKITAGDMSQWYNLNCAAGVSGQLTLNVSGPVTYVSPSLGSLTPLVSGTTFTYNITDFGTVNFLNDFNLIFKTDTTANSGDSICVNANITFINGDNNSNNNPFHYCYSVTNSHDPNMKEVYPINVESDYNDWFTYTIHFQNTGNATAFNIRLVDTLDSNLDLGTFKVINYSHNNTWSIDNKVVFFNFQDIQLPDSSTDTKGSKGYVQYKIKPKNNLGAGTKIKNTAYIYFDYNSPIITNTTINEYLQVVSVKELSMGLQSKIYPNPNNGSFTIELSTKEKQTIQLFDITGNSLLSQTIENGKGTIDASHLSAGVYNVSIKGNTSVINKKVVIVK